MESRKVNLFVVGAMKAGTTSFMELLSRHQDIYVSPIKEPHYFIKSLPKSLYEPSRFFSIDDYFDTDFPKPIHITKIEKEIHYQKLFSLSKHEKYLVDGSTAYLSALESASLIYNYNPNAKIIILRRPPLQRAYSHYKMDLGLGRVKNSFDELLQYEIKSYKEGSISWSGYLGMSFYKKSFNRYNNLFKNVIIIDFNDLINNRLLVLEKVSNFLEIETFGILDFQLKNVTKTLRFQKLFYYLKKLGVKDYFSQLFSHTFKKRIFKIASKSEKESLELSNTTLKEVEKIFKEES